MDLELSVSSKSKLFGWNRFGKNNKINL